MGYSVYHYPDEFMGNIVLIDGAIVVDGPASGDLRKMLEYFRKVAKIELEDGTAKHIGGTDEELYNVIPRYFRGAYLLSEFDDKEFGWDEDAHKRNPNAEPPVPRSTRRKPRA